MDFETLYSQLKDIQHARFKIDHISEPYITFEIEFLDGPLKNKFVKFETSDEELKKAMSE